MKKKNFLLVCFVTIMMNSAVGENPYMGEYQGDLGGHPAKAFVLAQGGQNYRVGISVLDGLAGFELSATEMDGSLCILGEAAGRSWNGRLSNGRMTLDAHYYGLLGEFNKVERPLPTLGQKPPENAVVLLPYDAGKKTTLDEWTNKNWILSEDGSMQVNAGGNSTLKHFSNIRLHLEFCLPLETWKIGQHRANSGVFLNDSSYEIQVLDSFGLMPSHGDCGSIYSIKAPSVNATHAPEQWQTYDITFYAPVMENDKIIKKPRITVVHNGVLIHDDVEIPRSTIDPKHPQKASGPIHLQDHGSAVRYRNIWAVELD